MSNPKMEQVAISTIRTVSKDAVHAWSSRHADGARSTKLPELAQIETGSFVFSNAHGFILL
jgi:hypothetical protein